MFFPLPPPKKKPLKIQILSDVRHTKIFSDNWSCKYGPRLRCFTCCLCLHLQELIKKRRGTRAEHVARVREIRNANRIFGRKI
jgi:hypothetical protein